MHVLTCPIPLGDIAELRRVRRLVPMSGFVHGKIEGEQRRHTTTRPLCDGSWTLYRYCFLHISGLSLLLHQLVSAVISQDHPSVTLQIASTIASSCESPGPSLD